MSKNTGKSEWSLEKEDTWRSLAIALAIVTPTLAAFALPWVGEASDDQRMLYRVQIVGAGVAVGLALITFCTVVWRGMISARQADIGLEQLEGLKRQIAVTEENNLAQLLQKGAELLSEEKPAHIAAGIAILHAVGVTPGRKFSQQTLDLLADFIATGNSYEMEAPNMMAAIDALAAVHIATGLLARRRIEFRQLEENSDTEYDATPMQFVTGVRSVVYEGGFFNGLSILPDNVSSTRSTFELVLFDGGYFDLALARFHGCQFRYGKIERYRLQIKDCKFEHCDFSGCVMPTPDKFPDLRTFGNWYDPKNPPVSDEPYDWSEKLHRGPSPPDYAEDEDSSLFSLPSDPSKIW